MPVCLIAAGKATTIALASFTLGWTHSVEKVRWEEDWTLTEAGALRIVEARVQGTGAGMEIPDSAVLKDGVWRYRPSLPPQKALLLARSGMTVGGWEICAEGRCVTVGAEPDQPAEIRACPDGAAISAQ